MGADLVFCGEVFPIAADRTLSIGREGDVAIDDNPYLHRRFLELKAQGNLVWLVNVGTHTSATIADEAGLVQSWLSPGARVPLVFARTMVWFTAGPTTYEFEVTLDEPPFVTSGEIDQSSGETTRGRVSFTPDQRLLILSLAERMLRRGGRGQGNIPSSAAAAERLDWTITKFNRKLDNVCEKLAKMGVRGLVGTAARTASNRRVRLVEYALAARLVTAQDLEYLDAIDETRV